MGAIRVAVLGAGKIASRHAEGFQAASGFQLAGVADLIPGRRQSFSKVFGPPGATMRHSSASAGGKEPDSAFIEAADVEEVLSDRTIDAISICLPTHLHLPVTAAALKSGKHVLCEIPPALDATECKRLGKAAERSGKVLLFAAQNRFGAHERAARQAIEKGYAGHLRHARASWMRTRAIPAGASFAPSGSIEPGTTGVGWYADKSRSGGGVLMDLGAQILDVAHDLLGSPNPLTVFAVAGADLSGLFEERTDIEKRVEESFFAILRFEGGKTLELSSAWAINQPPHQNGKICRLHGDRGAIDLYTRQGPVLYRDFTSTGDCKETLMKLPKLAPYPAMMSHFRECIHGKASPAFGAQTAAGLMRMIDAIYRSIASGKSVDVR